MVVYLLELVVFGAMPYIGETHLLRYTCVIDLTATKFSRSLPRPWFLLRNVFNFPLDCHLVKPGSNMRVRFQYFITLNIT